MLYLDDPPTTYVYNPNSPDDSQMPASNASTGTFANGVFTADGLMLQPAYLDNGPVFTVSGTISLGSDLQFSDFIYEYLGHIVAVGPDSFVTTYQYYIGTPKDSENMRTGYIEFTNPALSTTVGSFDYTPYQYNSTISCFASGTRIGMARGSKLVEAIRPGDKVRTVTGELRSVIWCGSRRIDCRWHPDPRAALPVRVAPDAFAPGQPSRALLLSPDHAMFAAGVLVPVRYLLNGTTIRQITVQEVTYHHIELETHDVILAEGLPCETFLDTGNRASLTSDRQSSAALPDLPDLTYLLWETQGYAPLLTGGPQVDSIRAGLADRAHALPVGHAKARPRLRA
jgi:hypothetical protein